jgi:AcrR family transcriptional regulator
MTEVIPRRDRKKAALRVCILTTAIELFSRHGFAEVTVDQIAEACDVGKGTIYNYFNAKEDIVVAFMAGLEARVQAKLGKFLNDMRPLDTVLAEFILFQFRLKRPYHQFVRVFLAQMFLQTGQFFPYMVEMQKSIDPNLESLFQGLQKRGQIRAEIEISELILAFKTMHLGLTALWAIEGPPFRQTTRTVRQEMKLLCEGLERKNK